MGDADAEHYLKTELYSRVRESDEIFEFLQSGSLDGIWYWDIENPEQEWLSPRFKEIFGYAEDEMADNPEWWQANIHPDDLEIVLDNFARHVADPEHPYDQVVRYRHRDGSTVWVRCRGMAIRDEDGTAVRMLGAHTDVTALMRTREELEHSNRALEEFAYIASHDLREPLRGVQIYSSFLAEDHGEALGEEGQELIRKLAGQVQRMDTLLTELLAYSKLRRTETEIAGVDLGEIMDDIAGTLEVSLDVAGVELRTAEDFPTIQADRVRVTEMLRNLVTNALKYRDGPGRIEVGWSGTASHPNFFVADDGIGIPAQYQDRIFRVFTRLHGRGEYGGGTGSGMTFARTIVEQHGGRMWLDSEPGRGTTVWFTLDKAARGFAEEHAAARVDDVAP